jgi:hypothetical protein
VNDTHANAFVRLDAGCGKRTLVMKSYYAPSADGTPHDQQVKFDEGDPAIVKTGGSNAWVKVNVKMPPVGCFFQVDLVDITNGESGAKNPIVRAKTGGNKDCRPDQTHTYACTSIGLTPGDNRTVTISAFSVTASTGVSFTGATIDWSDGAVQAVGNALNQSHTFAKDGDYNVKVTAHFTYAGQFGGIHNVDAAPCAAPISFTTPPPTVKTIFVCEIATKRIIQIDQTLYGGTQYPLDRFTKDLSQCVVTPPPTEVQPAKLVNTGPGAVLIVLGLAILGGYAFHMRHRHVQHKKHHAR